jgi:hypothetical protein
MVQYFNFTLKKYEMRSPKILKQLQGYQMTVIKINFTYIFGDAGQLKLVWAWTNEVLQQ